jgi:NAD(P)-dependent dehydrogenase (short-subunit alcohol dehydrogenase family)
MTPAADRFDLSGRKAVVTGASRGIGFAMAQALAEAGASIVITGRKADTLTAAADQLRAGGANVQPVVCHQGDPAAIASLFEQLDRQGAAPEIVVINAATNPAMGPLLQTDLAAWQKILEVNLTGSLIMAQQAARRMLRRKKGSLILMASIAGLDPMPAIPAYSVSKAGVIGLTKALAKELGPAGIRVNAIAPGLVETRFAAALFQNRQLYERVLAEVPLGRHGQPEDIVGAALFLASDASAYVTGQVLVVDGGAHM